MPVKRGSKATTGVVVGGVDVGVRCCENSDTCPIEARTLLQQRLYQPNSQHFIEDFMSSQQAQLKSVVEQCVTVGESNSVLVIGPRGSGKTVLVEQVMRCMGDSYCDNYIPVYLSGHIHTTDALALKDMARQLQLENVIGDRVFGSFADNLAFLLDSLKKGTEETKSIVVVLDEFDGFTAHKNQSLLYNLFDIAQSRQSPLCVIGITTRLDVVELLEKRVKSRYSHRVILTFPNYDFDYYLDILRNLLHLPHHMGCSMYKRKWDQHLKSLLESVEVVELLRRHFSMYKDIRNLINLFVIPLTNITTTHPFVTQHDVKTSYDNIHKDTKVELLLGLSTLELCLVVAAQHVCERREGEPFNFEMLYNEYQTFAKRRLQGMQHFNKPVTVKAFEHLQSLELFKQTDRGVVGSSSSNSLLLAKEYRQMFMLVTPTQIQQALNIYPDCPTELKNWAEYVYT